MGNETIDDPKLPSCGLAWRLHEHLHGAAAGRRLSFLALDPARRHFGDDWLRVAAKVHAVVSATLKRFLSSGDVHFLADELSYVIVSGGRTSDEIDKVMEQISAEISARITGKGIARDLVRVIHLSAETEAASASGRPKVPAMAAVDAKEHMDTIQRIVADAEAGATAFKMDEMEIVLSPVLSTASMATSAWVCLPTRDDEDGITHRGYALLPADMDPVIYAELDARTAEFAARQLKDAADRQMTVQIPVHRTTLSSKKYREMYLKICQGLLVNRKDRIIFDIHGIDEGTPSNRIAEYMQWLRPYARSVAITLDMDFAAISTFSGINAISIGTDIPRGDDGTVVPKIGKFIGRVKAMTMKCHIHGVSTKAQADICLQLGIDYMDGGLIHDGP